MLLKRLDLAPDLAALLPLLESRGVRTTEQLLLARDLPPGVEGLVSAAAARFPLTRGQLDEEKEEEEEEERGIFGVPGLDALLPSSGVIELAGAKGTGKSLLALHATLRALGADRGATARWVDTEGAFSAPRAHAVLSSLGLDDSVLDRLTVSSLFRLDPELFAVLDEVRSESRTTVLVLDNVAALFRDALMGATAQGHAAMVLAMGAVAELSYSRNMLTIVTNSPASSLPSNPLSAFSSTTTKPALGVSFSYTVDVEVLLQDTARAFPSDLGERERAGEPGARVLAEVLKSRVGPSGTWTVFETDGTTLRDVVPPEP